MSREDDIQTVERLDIEYQAAVERNDAAAMDRILADDFRLVTGHGLVFDKSDLLRDANEARTVYEVQRGTERTVRVWGDTAVVTALLEARGTREGKTFDYRVWYSDTYVRFTDGWRYVLGQASTLMTPD